MNQDAQDKKVSKLIAKSWADEGFKKKLMADPAATLKAEGVDLSPGVSYKIVENTDKVVHLVIPAKPTDLSEDDLDQVSAGDCTCDHSGRTYTGSIITKKPVVIKQT